jgi:hypothetical protein
LIRGMNSRSVTWQQALLLVVSGLVIGYPSLVGATNGMWGGGQVSPHQGLYVILSFASAVAFISGFASFLLITVKTLTTPAGSAVTIVTQPLPSGAGVSRAAPAQVAFNAVGDGNPSLPNSAAFNALRLTLVAVICLAAYFVLRDWGRPPLSSSYGRSYWLIAFLALLLRELSFAVAITRTWKAPVRAGLALAMIAGVTDLLYLWDPSARSPWLTTCFGLAAVVLACLVWRRPSLSRKGDVGLIISIFFGLAAYTVLTRIAVLILASRLRA